MKHDFRMAAGFRLIQMSLPLSPTIEKCMARRGISEGEEEGGVGALGARTRSARHAKRPRAAHQAEGSRRARRRLARHRYSELVTSQEEDDDEASEADSELAEAVRLLPLFHSLVLVA